MGTVAAYKCKCGYETELFIGCGLAYKNKDIIERCIPAEEYARFEDALSQGEASDFLLSHAVICCNNCHKLYTVVDFSYSVLDEKIRYTAPCPDCGLECEPLLDTDSIRCPKCRAVMTGKTVGQRD